MTGINVT